MIDGSAPTPDICFEKVRLLLRGACADTSQTSESLGALVAQTAATHNDELGDLAEFWLLLAVCEIFAHPRQMNQHNVAAYLTQAQQCADLTSELVSEHIAFMADISAIRSHRSDFQAHITVRFAKGPFKKLERQLTFAT